MGFSSRDPNGGSGFSIGDNDSECALRRQSHPDRAGVFFADEKKDRLGLTPRKVC